MGYKTFIGTSLQKVFFFFPFLFNKSLSEEGRNTGRAQGTRVPSAGHETLGRCPLSSLQSHPRGGSAPCPLTQHVSGVDLQDQPAVAILLVGAKDGEDGALLAGLGQEAVHEHRLLREREDFPGFPFVCAVPAQKRRLGEMPGASSAIPSPSTRQSLCPDTHLSWSVSVPWAMATRIPPWSPQV